MPQLELNFEEKLTKREPLPDAGGIRGETTARLRELLDRCQWELTRFGFEEDVAREVSEIEAELRERAQARIRTLLDQYG